MTSHLTDVTNKLIFWQRILDKIIHSNWPRYLHQNVFPWIKKILYGLVYRNGQGYFNNKNCCWLQAHANVSQVVKLSPLLLINMWTMFLNIKISMCVCVHTCYLNSCPVVNFPEEFNHLTTH